MAEHEIILFGLHLKINPVAFSVGSFSIYWYGIIIAVGFSLAVVYAWRKAPKFGINLDRMLDVVLVTTPLAVLCARAYYLIFDGDGIHSFSQFFGIKSGGFAGLAIYGGVIGAAVIGPLMCKWRKVNIASMLDLASIGFLIGQGIGRWGNFTNQEAFGIATGSSWFGMTSRNVERVLGVGELAHPCFLYESVWCLVGAFLLHKIGKNRRFNGQVALSYCMWYGLGRAVIEGLRTDSLYLGSTGIRVSQLLSVLAVIVAAVLYAVFWKRLKTAKRDTEYQPMFGEMPDAVMTAEGTPEEPAEPETEPDSGEESMQTEAIDHGDDH